MLSTASFNPSTTAVERCTSSIEVVVSLLEFIVSAVETKISAISTPKPANRRPRILSFFSISKSFDKMWWPGARSAPGLGLKGDGQAGGDQRLAAAPLAWGDSRAHSWFQTWARASRRRTISARSSSSVAAVH